MQPVRLSLVRNLPILQMEIPQRAIALARDPTHAVIWVALVLGYRKRAFANACRLNKKCHVKDTLIRSQGPKARLR